MPSETRVGQIVHISRGYTVAEIVQSHLGDSKVVGYSVFGHRSDTAKLFQTKEEAIAELTEIANSSAADWMATQRHPRR